MRRGPSLNSPLSTYPLCLWTYLQHAWICLPPLSHSSWEPGLITYGCKDIGFYWNKITTKSPSGRSMKAMLFWLKQTRGPLWGTLNKFLEFQGLPKRVQGPLPPTDRWGTLFYLSTLLTHIFAAMPKQSFTQDNLPWACDNPTPERKHRESTFSSCWSSCAVLCTLHVYISPIQNWINSTQTVIAPHNKRNTELLNYNFLLCQNSTIL